MRLCARHKASSRGHIDLRRHWPPAITRWQVTLSNAGVASRDPDLASEPLRYPLSPRLRARLFGSLLAVLGVLLVVGTVAVALTGSSGDLITALVVIVLLVIVAGGYAVVHRWAVLTLDRTGYRIRFAQGVGCRQARWSDVDDVSAAYVGSRRCLVLRLTDGRATTLPVDFLAGSPDDIARQVRDYLSPSPKGRRRQGRTPGG